MDNTTCHSQFLKEFYFYDRPSLELDEDGNFNKHDYLDEDGNFDEDLIPLSHQELCNELGI